MSLVDPDGIPLDPIERAMALLARRVAEGMYDDSPEARVDDLRRSILGDDAPPPSTRTGLAAWLPT